MDSKLQELKRLAVTDPEAGRQYYAQRCRLDGHQYTPFHRFENPLTNDWVAVCICWMCHSTEVHSDQKHDNLNVPEYFIYKSNNFNSPCHIIREYSLQETLIPKAKRKKSLDLDVEETEIDKLRRTRIKVHVNAVCGQRLVVSNPVWFLNFFKMQGKKATCDRCLRNKHLEVAKENTSKVFRAAYRAARIYTLQVGAWVDTAFIPKVIPNEQDN